MEGQTRQKQCWDDIFLFFCLMMIGLFFSPRAQQIQASRLRWLDRLGNIEELTILVRKVEGRIDRLYGRDKLDY